MKRYFFIDSPKGIYSSPKDVEGGSVNDKTDIFKAGCNVIYDIYDDLAERFCDYVNKVKIGEVSGYDYNRYTFSNYDIENASSFPVKPFKIILITAVHGYEPGCAWTAAQFFKLMCENPDDEILGFLRRNVVFEVLPIANPYGFANNKRANENDTDINRNFDYDWVSIWNKDHYGYYAGDFPGSEPETKMIIEFLKENSDAEWLIDYHNISRPYPLIFAKKEDDARLAYSVFSALTYKWQKEYEGIEKDRILGTVRNSGQGGMLAKYANGKLGINSLCLETPELMQGVSENMYDKNTVRTALDVLVNTILALVKGE